MIPARNRWYRDALAGPHEAYSRVEVWRAGIQVDELAWRDPVKPYSQAVPVFHDGSVRATLSSRVTRQLTLTVPYALFPRRTTDLLAPYGNELRVFRGVRYGNGSPDEFPIFTGPIMRARPPQRGQVTIEASDNSARVAGAGFLAPLASQAGDLVVDEFERLVLDAYPAARFGTHSNLTARVPVLAYDNDPGTAADSLAETAGAFWYCLADGSFVIRRVPWTVAPTSAPIVLRDGPGGTLISGYPDRNAASLVNRVTIVSDRTDGAPASWATAQDDDPTSPTFVNGPFGVRSTRIRVTGATNQGQLLALARQLITRTRVRSDSWAITCVPDASIELGDPLDVTYQGEQALQLVAGFSMPLNPNASMTIDGRGLNTGAPEDS